MSGISVTDEILDGLAGVAVKGALAELAIVEPWTKLPIIDVFVNAAVNKIANIILTKTELAAYFVFSDVIIGDETKAYQEAAFNYFSAQKSGDADAISKTQTIYVAAARELIKLGNIK